MFLFKIFENLESVPVKHAAPAIQEKSSGRHTNSPTSPNQRFYNSNEDTTNTFDNANSSSRESRGRHRSSRDNKMSSSGENLCCVTVSYFFSDLP